jgi:membrane protease YdiL (CAAX protease family)
MKYAVFFAATVFYLAVNDPAAAGDNDKIALFINEHKLTLTLIANAVGLGSFYLEWRKHKNKYTRWNGDKPTAPALALGVVIAAALGVAISGVSSLAGRGAELRADTCGDMIVRFLALGILEPMTAELVFRGLTLNSLRYQRLWTAILIQAGLGAVYGVMFFGVLDGLVLGLVLGVFLGFIYTRFRSIWIPILAGIAFSVTSIAASYIFTAYGTAIKTAAIVGGAAIAGVCFLPLLKLKRPKPITADDVLAEQREKRAEAERREDEARARRGTFFGGFAPSELYGTETVGEAPEEPARRPISFAAVWRALYPTLIYATFLMPVFWLLPYFIPLATLYEFEEYFRLLPPVLGIAVFLPMWLKTRKEAPRYVNKHFPRLVALTIGLFAGFSIFVVGLMALTGAVRLAPESTDVSADLSWVRLLGVVILAPIAEELCDRGVTLNRLNWLTKWEAILVGAVMFALLHRELYLMINVFPCGILIGALYMKFRSIIAVIAGHSAYNLFVSVLKVISVSAPRYVAFAVPLALAVISALCAYVLIKLPGAGGVASGHGTPCPYGGTNRPSGRGNGSRAYHAAGALNARCRGRPMCLPGRNKSRIYPDAFTDKHSTPICMMCIIWIIFIIFLIF